VTPPAIIRPGEAAWPAHGASGPFIMDRDWLPFHPAPRQPRFTPPQGAVDAHCHVFGPGAQFPYVPERKYTPCDAPKAKLWGLRDYLGFERNVIVQATCHGSDNRAVVDALRDADGRARGVATVAAGVSDRELAELDAAGVRGVRFNFVKRLVDTTPREVLLVKLMREHPNIWSKVSCPDRLSKSGPPDYADVVAFARRIIETFPERVLWGTDWPHPNLKPRMPDDGDLVDFIPKIATTEALQRQLLVDNPLRLYFRR